MRSLPLIGKLTQDPDIPEWWTSQPIAVPFFSGTPLPFTIMAEGTDLGYPPDVADAIRQFLSLNVTDRAAASERVFAHYREFAEAVEDVGVEIDDSAKVWMHVRPTAIYVDRRHRREKDIYVQVACNCDWEIEHGLQLVYRRGAKLTRVSDQDGHLTQADACDLLEDQEDA
ncbi:MAG: DUF6985 domain-containing protein [Gemmataceae bacterium]